MNEYAIRPVETTPPHIDTYVALFKACFPKATIFTPAYLKWLYCENPEGPPVGFDAWDGNTLAAHYVTVPLRCRIAGREARGLLSLNTATHPNYQGKGLFTQLAQATYKRAQEMGVAAVVGVANQNSTHGFINRLGFQLVKPLPVHIGVGNPAFSPTEAAAKATSFMRVWSPQAFEWRLRNPERPLACTTQADGTLAITGKTHLPGFSVIGLRSNPGISPAAPASGGLHFGPRVFVGTLPSGCRVGATYLPLPKQFKSSPLNFIYLSLDRQCMALEPEHVFFDFMDFDVF